MLTAFQWREELRARQKRALEIANENERLHGLMDNRTLNAYAHYDNLTAVCRAEGA